MSLSISTSPDISILDFGVLFDISTATPHVIITNLSSGPDLASCVWWYELRTPSTTPIHLGVSTSPDMSGVWTPVTVPDTWPLFDSQIEFSNSNPYSITLFVKDGAGNIFQLNKTTLITRPNGNEATTIGNFGVAAILVEVMCSKSKIYGSDTTNYAYQTKLGTMQTNKWTLAYPMDSNGNIPAPFDITNAPKVIFPIGFSAEGYQIYMNSFATYDFGGGVTIKIQYKFQKVFAVYCNVDLCALTCEIDGMRKSLESNCGITEAGDIRDKLLRIDTILIQCLIGISMPLCGKDVPAMVEEIKKIGGFTCCCVGTTGINPTALPGDVTISLDLLNGLTGSVTNTGNNYTLHLNAAGVGGDLAVVTGRGAITATPMEVGVHSGAHSVLASTVLALLGSATDTLIGFEVIGGAPFLRIKGSTSGIINVCAAAVTAPYTLTLPAAQGTGYIYNPGTGLLEWAAAAAASLQAVTTVGSKTNQKVMFTNALETVNVTIDCTGSVPIIKLENGGFTLNFASATLTAGRNIIIPNRSGFLTIDMLYSNGTDTNLSIPSNMIMRLPNISANRTVGVSAGVVGDRLCLMNHNAMGFTWTLLVGSQAFIGYDGVTTVSTLANGTVYNFYNNGTEWLRV